MADVIATEQDCKNLDSSITISNANHCPNKSEILGFGGTLIISGDYKDNQLVAKKDLIALGEVVWEFTTVDQSSSAYAHGLSTNINFSGFDWYGFYGSNNSMIFRYTITVGTKTIDDAYYSVDASIIKTGNGAYTDDYISLGSTTLKQCTVSCSSFTTDETYTTSSKKYPIFGQDYPGIVWAKIQLDLKYEDQIIATKYICAAFGPNNIITSGYYYRPVIGVTGNNYHNTICGLYTTTTPSSSNIKYANLGTPTTYDSTYTGFTITNAEANSPQDIHVFPLHWGSSATWQYRNLSLSSKSSVSISSSGFSNSKCKLLLVKSDTSDSTIYSVQSVSVPVTAGTYYFFNIKDSIITKITISA